MQNDNQGGIGQGGSEPLPQPALELTAPASQEIVRSEVNLKRWSNFLFPRHRTKNLERPRSIVRDYTLPDGTPGTQKLTIKPATESRAYTTYTHRVFLALVMLWYEKGKPDGTVTFSLRELGRKLNLTVWGGSAATRLARARLPHRDHDQLDALLRDKGGDARILRRLSHLEQPE